MEDKKIELISAKGAMGVTEFALLYFPDCTPEIRRPVAWRERYIRLAEVSAVFLVFL